MDAGVNFEVWLSDERGCVPGSLRAGHNVFTNFGRLWLRGLAAWSSVGGEADAATDARRLRWIALGGGSQLEQVGVSSLVTPLTVTTGPDVYLRELPAPDYPTPFSVRFVSVFSGGGADLDHHGLSVDLSEAALYVDVDDGGGPVLDVGVGTYEPVAYKRFTPLTKAQAQTLTITWELRF